MDWGSLLHVELGSLVTHDFVLTGGELWGLESLFVITSVMVLGKVICLKVWGKIHVITIGLFILLFFLASVLIIWKIYSVFQTRLSCFIDKVSDMWRKVDYFGPCVLVIDLDRI